jgi:hypothetical protein
MRCSLFESKSLYIFVPYKERAGFFGFSLQNARPWLRSTTPPFWLPTPNARDIQSGFLPAHEELRNLRGDDTSFLTSHHLLSSRLSSASSSLKLF